MVTWSCVCNCSCTDAGEQAVTDKPTVQPGRGAACGGCVGEVLGCWMQEPEDIIQTQCMLQWQQAILEAVLAGAWLPTDQVLVSCHTIPVSPQTKGFLPAVQAGAGAEKMVHALVCYRACLDNA